MKSYRPDADPARRVLSPRLLGLGSVALISVLSCTPWPMGDRISSDNADLLGEWRDSQQQNVTSQAVLRFGRNGRSELLHVKTEGVRVIEDTVWTSRWALHRGHAPDSSSTVVCFNAHRGRSWPMCKSVHIDSVNDDSGRLQQRLTLEGWLGYPHLTKEVWFRRVPL